MSKTRDTGFLANVINLDQNGNVSIVSGSTVLMSISSSGAITTTGVISGSNAANASLLNGTGSVGFTTTGSFTVASSSLSTRTTQIEQVYATTGSNSFRATQSITGSLTVTGQIIAQTINVQQVTSSIVFSSGSNTFGCDLNSRQTFTGSVLVTGSLTVNTTGPELQVNNTGVILGNLLTDNHSITGSLRITGSSNHYIMGCNLGIGTTSPVGKLNIWPANNSLAVLRGNAGVSTSVPAFEIYSHNSSGTQGGIAINTFDTTSQERLRITYDGLVGIGTSCPLTTLTVKSTNDNGYALTRPSNDTTYHWRLSTTETGGDAYTVRYNTFNNDMLFTTYVGGGTGGNIVFRTGPSSGAEVERVRITSAGNACVFCQLSVGPSITVGNQGGTDTTVIGGGSGVGSLIRMNYAGGAYNNYLAGNGDNYFNCLLGKLNAAGGVKFGSGATTLNYYESGTWTPQLYWSGGGYYCMSGGNGGNYVRIGNVVSVNYTLQWSGLCGSSGFGGQLRIGGLPFTVGSYRSAGTISAISSGIGRSVTGITWHANTVDPGANFVYWIENDPTGGYSHSPSVGASGLVYSYQVTYALH